MSLSIQRFCCASSSCATRWVWAGRGVLNTQLKRMTERHAKCRETAICASCISPTISSTVPIFSPFLKSSSPRTHHLPPETQQVGFRLAVLLITVKSGIKESVQLDTVHRRSPERLLVGFHKELVFWTKIIEQLVRAPDFVKTSNQGAVIHTPDVEVKVALLFYAVEWRLQDDLKEERPERIILLGA